MTARPTNDRGFTLIELILVMIVISIVLALATPTLSGWGKGQKLRNAADGFIAATGFARGQAVTTASPYAVEIDPGANTYVVQSVDAGGVRTPAAGEHGRVTELPESFTIKLVSGGEVAATSGKAQPKSGGTGVLVFYPDARGTPAVIEITSPTGEVARIASDSPAEPFAKVDVTP